MLSLSWPAHGFTPLLLVAWIPILFAGEIHTTMEPRKKGWFVFLSNYTGFLVFNLLTTWWVKYASFFGAIAAIFCNALFMALVFQCFHIVKNRSGNLLGYASLITFWISFEHLHMDWDLSWPWLTIGNGLAGMPLVAQWYEYTGVLGGSIWILLANILILQSLLAFMFNHNRTRLPLLIGLSISWILIPVVISILIYNSYKEESDPVDIVVVQPNVDPYNEKFSGLSERQQLDRILALVDSLVLAEGSVHPDYIVAPETALPSGMWEEDMGTHPQSILIRKYSAENKVSAFVIGAATNRLYPDSNLRSLTARKFLDADIWYDSYNTALMFDCDSSIQIHHKSKLVPGVEKMPFPFIFRHLEGLAIDLGGITGSLGVQESPSVFADSCSKRKFAPVICYESVYGDYVTDYVRKGAGLIFIITNDGWWDDTPGYRQHQAYARLRAIEVRRSIARSANTGISCFINQRGDVSQATAWWVPKAIRQKLNYNSYITFYARHGDYLGTIALLLSLGIIVFSFVYSKRVGFSKI